MVGMTIFCVGRNYAAHAREMGTPADPDAEPVIFLKPEGALLAPPGPIRLPPDAGEVHHEAELVVRVGPDARADAVALGLDLTDRTRQKQARRDGMPWAAAKGFRGSAPLGPFVPVVAVAPLDTLVFTLAVNDVVRQRGETRLLLHPVGELLAYLERWFGLAPGDLVFTGTPEGVGPVRPEDVLELALEGHPAAGARFTVA